MSSTTLAALKNRRSIYMIGKNVSKSNDEIEALIKEAVRLAPSSFNSQSSRVVILFGEASDRFWSITTECLRAIVPAEAFASTEGKMKMFAAGVGTVLFYEDEAAVKALQDAYPAFAAAFPGFSEHSSGMAQLAVWTVLSEAGIGATLQHYHPIIDEAVAKEFNIPATWSIKAQMPFGSIEAAAGDKTFIEDETRFVTFGK